jgi:hypothetical protein
MRGRQDVGQMVAVETGGGQLSTSNLTQSDSNPVQPFEWWRGSAKRLASGKGSAATRDTKLQSRPSPVSLLH